MKNPLFILIPALCLSPVFSQEPPTVSGIPAPAGYARKTFAQGTFSHFVQNLPLKKSNRILVYTGDSLAVNYYDIFAVADMPLLFKSDLEQCADYCMRLWAEFHKSQNTLEKLYLFDYNGKKKKFSTSGKSYSSFLKQAFSCSNSYSLKKGCAEVKEDSIIPGDMFVQNQNGGIGHVSMVVDMAESKDGKKVYLIGFSFMPAQEFHIEKASDVYGIGGWFTFEGFCKYLDDFLALGKPVLRRFKE